MKSIIAQALVMLIALVALNERSVGQWQPTGGLHHSGKVSFAQIGDTLFCSCEYGTGVFRSTDHGASWQDASNGLPEFAGIIDIVAHNGVLLGGVEHFGGMYRSTDRGNHWALANSISGFPSIFLQNQDYIFYTNGYLHRSSDDGSTWLTFRIDSGVSIYSLCMNDSLLFAGTNKGIFTSNDWGEHWDSLGGPQKSVYSMFTYDASLFITSGSVFFRSTDDGKHWDTIQSIRYLGNRVYTAATSKSLFLADRNGILRSTDGGFTWAISDSSLSDKIVTGIWADQDTVLVGSYSDWLSRSTDGGKTWKRLTGGGAINYVYTTSLAAKDNSLFVSSDWGIYRSDDDGKTWAPKNNGQYERYTASIESRPVLMFCKGNEYLYYSADLGEHWISMGNFGQGILSIVDGVIYMSWSSSIFASRDIGKTWSELVIDTLNMWSLNNWETHFYEVNRSVFVAGSGNYGYSKLAYSTNRGINWTVLHWFDSSNTQITSLASIGDTLFLGAKDSGIYFSTDFGLNWEKANTGLENLRVQVLISEGRTLFAGTAKGVFYSWNKGKSWKPMNEGLLDSSISALLVYKGYLYMGGSNGYFTNTDVPTYNGIYRYPLAKLSVEKTAESEESVISISASPNPFTTETSFTINCPESMPLKFEIYDILGKKIYDGGEKVYSKGENSITLNTSAFPDGFLFGRFTSSIGNTQSIKLFKLQSQR